MKQTLLIALSLCLLFAVVPAVFANGLGFSDITVEVEGEDDDDVDAAGGTFDVTPRDLVEITIEIENTFALTTDGHKIKNIDVSLNGDTFCRRDLDTEVDEEVRLEDLSPGKDDSATFRFYIPECAEEDTYDLDIVVKGKDDYDGTRYSISETLSVHVEKNPSEVTLALSEPEPQTLSCERTFTTTVEVHNIGSLDEDAGLLLINDDLGINTFRYLDLRTGKWTDSDTYFVETFFFPVDDDVPAGEYSLRAEVEYDKNRREIKRYQTVTVEDCEEETNEEIIEAEELVTTEITGEELDQEQEATELSSETEEKQKETMLFSTPFLIAALIGALLLLFVLLYLTKKKIL